MLGRIFKSALAFVLIVSLSGCFEETIKELVDKKFPPVDAEDHRSTAVATGLSALSVVSQTDLAVVVPIDDIQKFFDNTDTLSTANLASVQVVGDQQLLFVDIAVDGIFSSSMFDGMDAEDAVILDALKPKLVGTLKIGASIASAAAQDDDQNLVLNFRLLPLFREIRIEELNVAEAVDIAAPADFAAKIINTFADNISGELSRASFTKVTVPAVPVDSISTSVKKQDTLEDGTKVAVEIEGEPIASPVFVRAVAFKIEQDAVSVLVDLADADDEAPQPEAAEGDFSDFDEAFRNRLVELVPTAEQPSTIWAAVSKASVAHIVNSSFEQASLCVNGVASIPRQEFSKKIKIPDENTVDCTPTKNCTINRNCRQTRDCRQTEDCRQSRECRSSRNCSFAKPRDTRNCRVCILPRPWGGCAQHGNNPVCEAAKAAQNAIYDAEHAAKKADCERIKAQEKGQCEIEKKAAHDACELRKAGREADCERLKTSKRLACEAEKTVERKACEAQKTATKAFCEAGKETLKRLSRTGKFANVDGFAQASGNLRICIPHFVFDDSLSKLDVRLAVGGQADARVGLKFVPLDIVGHVTCPFKWTENKDIKLSLPNQDFSISANLNFQNADGNLSIGADVATSELALKLRPSPRQLIFDNYNMQLACPLAGGLLTAVRGPTLLVDATGAIPELSGNFVFPSVSRKFEFEVEPIEVELPSTDLSTLTSVSVGEKGIIVSIEVQE